MLRRNYACIASDMGHTGALTDAQWAHNNVQAQIDWGYRATHVVALAGKAIVARFYYRPPKKSYFLGCSTGGRQGLQEAQRFPWDFDGIVAGAPPINLSTVYMTFAWAIIAAHDRSDRPLLRKEDLKLLTDTVIAKCDVDDGIKDGVISDPLDCPFDPSELTCKLRQSQTCLTPNQVDAVKKIYEGPTTASGTKLSLGGPLVGSELSGWPSYLATGNTPPRFEALTINGFRSLSFSIAQNQGWKLRDFDFDSDYKRLDVMQTLYDSSNPDLQRFRDAGGKLLVFQGLNDNAVLPRDTISYYKKVQLTMGGETCD